MYRKLLKLTMVLLVLTAFFVIPIGVLLSHQNLFVPLPVHHHGEKCNGKFDVITQNPCRAIPPNNCWGQQQDVKVIETQCEPTPYYPKNLCYPFVVQRADGNIPCILVTHGRRVVPQEDIPNFPPQALRCEADPNVPIRQFSGCR